MNLRWLKINLLYAAAGLGCILALSLSAQEKTPDSAAGLLSQNEGPSGSQRLQRQRELLARCNVDDATKQKVIASMLEEYASDANPAGRATALTAQATLLEEQDDLAKATEALDEALRLGERCTAQQPEVWFDAKVLQAKLAKNRHKYLQATALANDALTFAQPWGDRLAINTAYRVLAICAGQMGSTNESLKFYRLEIEHTQRTGNQHEEIAAAFPFVQQLLDFGQTEEASSWLEKMTLQAKRLNDGRMEILFSGFAENVRMRQGDPETAAANLRELLTADLSGLKKRDFCQLYLWLSQAESKLMNHEAALQANAKDRQYAEGNQGYILDAGLQRAKILLAADQAEQALRELTILESETKDLPDYERIRIYVASQAFYGMKNYELAFRSLARYQQMLSTDNREQAAGQLAFMNTLMKDRDRELQLAEQKQVSAEAVVERQQAVSQAQVAVAETVRGERNMLAIGLLAIIGMGFTASKFWMARKLHSQSQQLNADLNQRLKQRTRELTIQTADRQKLELAIERQRRDQALGQLTGGVAHDFNNLLTIIMQSNELARRFDPDLSSAAREQLQTSMQAATTGARIVKQLLGFACKSSLNPEVLDLIEWKSNVGELFEHVVGHNHLEIMVDTSSEQPPVVNVDDAQLTTSVINLLSNARDAMDVPGNISLRVFAEDIRKRRAGVGGEIPTGNYIVVEVADDGPGMSPEQQEKACEPYYTTKVQGAGTGLGLSSVLGFVNQSSGHLQISSEPGCGTIIRIFLPRVQHPVCPVGIGKRLGSALSHVEHV